MPPRRLSRKTKDMVIMRQFGRCGYCTVMMTDSAQTDHMDENCGNDAWSNLIACCCNCHGDKTQHYRKRRHSQLQAMLETGRQNKAAWIDEWSEQDDHYSKLPDWLRARVGEHSALVYSARQRAKCVPLIDLEQFRYRSGHDRPR